MNFESFSLQHLGAVITFILLTFIIILTGRRSNVKTSVALGYGISLVAFIVLVADLIYRLSSGIFDKYVDLPLYLCDISALFLPFVVIARNRKWIGILYFWAMAGTLQALITPELEHGFPEIEFFRYFIMHGAIVTAILYVVIVDGIRINWQDFLHAIVYAQGYLITVHIINVTIGSNYSYTLHKPRDPTILDFMGSWPWYLLWGEIMMIVFFLVLMIPFVFRKPSAEDMSA